MNDIFETRAEALVVPVNCVGVAGKGLALEFRKRYPRWYEDYHNACLCLRLAVGDPWWWVNPWFGAKREGIRPLPYWIVSFPTKNHWRNKSNLETIKSGLCILTDDMKAKDVRSIAIPALGCGLGGLNWSDVELSLQAFAVLVPDTKVTIFPPKEEV
jgi:O-acetyl-ADP-ribose deacetylase (regulator of RNase III)